MIDTLTVTAVPVPESLDAPDAGSFLALVDVLNRALEHDLGLDHLRWEASEELPGWQDQTYRLRRGHVAWRGGIPVGAVAVTGPIEDGATELEFDLLAAPDARGQGVEAALLDAVLRDAAELGRTTLQTWSLHRTEALTTGGAHLPSPTGFGALPVDGQTAFYQENGFDLQQVERNSAFALAGDLAPVARMLAAAQQVAGPDYRLETWTSPTPEEFAEGLAWVLSRMSTDAPMAGLEIAEETWDVERVRKRDARLQASGLTVSVAAVVHAPTGRVVAYNELGIGEDRTRPTHQWGTLVTKEHRGHRLGTVVKCANILRWRELAPQSPFISTFNAEENRPMLDVNEAIGFTPLTVAGAWQRVLS